MIGNSVKSDVLPVLAIGGNAIHVPYESHWELDKIEHRGAEAEGFFEAASMLEVPQVLEQIAAQLLARKAAKVRARLTKGR